MAAAVAVCPGGIIPIVARVFKELKRVSFCSILRVPVSETRYVCDWLWLVMVGL